jgi:hypothetical protein
MRKLIIIPFALAVFAALSLMPREARAENIYKASITPAGAWASSYVGSNEICINVIGTATVTVLYYLSASAGATDAGLTKVDQAQFPGDCLRIKPTANHPYLNVYAASGTIDVYGVLK